jgi:hypothetical protein
MGKITHLNIDIQDDFTRTPSSKTVSNIFALILSLCKRLINLNFCEWCRYRSYRVCISKLPSTSCMSSTLTTLTINVATFNDCLHLLDGRLDCLSTLIIDVRKIRIPLPSLENTVSKISITVLRKTLN